MLPEKEINSIKTWIKYAKSDLDLARISVPETVLLETLCFHAQQAAEKSLKALLLYYSISIPRTHSIAFLLELVQNEVLIPSSIQDASILTDYAVETRYPGFYEPVTHTEYEEAVDLAETIVLWVESIIQEQ